MSNIVDPMVAERNLATMLRNVKAAHLETECTKSGPFTVFAPTDLAFEKLEEGEIIELSEPKKLIKLSGIFEL